MTLDDETRGALSYGTHIDAQAWSAMHYRHEIAADSTPLAPWLWLMCLMALIRVPIRARERALYDRTKRVRPRPARTTAEMRARLAERMAAR